MKWSNFIKIPKCPIRIKRFFWKLFPATITYYFKIKWSFYNNIIIVPHIGLGDIAVIVPALKKLEKKFEKIYIVGNNDYINAIKLLFDFSDKILIIDSQKNNKIYVDTLKQTEIKKYENFGKVILLGSHDNDPIINYPNSFFIKLGVSVKNTLDKYDLNIAKHLHNKDLRKMIIPKQKFNYININTSNGNLLLENISVFFDDSEQLISYGDSAVKIGHKSYIDTNIFKVDTVVESIINNVILCLFANKSVISDAGLFNIVIRFKICKDLTVFTRNHRHSHNNLLYKIQFNGKIQSRSSN